MSSVNRGTPRRGVILLIVLAMLAMFGLVALGFLAITGHNKRAAKTLAKLDQQAFSPQEDIHRAMLQAVRGTADGDSVLQNGSLLEDLYGNESFQGTVTNILFTDFNGDGTNDLTWVVLAPTNIYWNAMKPELLAGGQIFEFTIRDTNPQRFVGRTITFLNGPGEGVTTRVVGIRKIPDMDQGNGFPEPVTWVDAASGGSDGYGRFPRDPLLPGRPIWKLQVQSKGVLPLGPDGAPGVRGFNDDGTFSGDTVVDEYDEFALPWLPGLAPPPFPANDDLDMGNSFFVNGLPFSGTGTGFNPRIEGSVHLGAGAPWWFPTGFSRSEDRNGNGVLDLTEDTDGNGVLDPSEDLNGNGLLDPGEDTNGDGILDLNEDTNNNGVLDLSEDLNGNGILDVGPQQALLPNPTSFRPDPGSNYLDPAGPGGANEDYDAVDYQNMLMAMVFSNGQVPSPSLHRPALINYWFHRMVLDTTGQLIPWTDNLAPVYENRWLAVLDPVNYSATPQIRDLIVTLKRGFMMGPLVEDHPNFNSSNPERNSLLTRVLADLSPGPPNVINTTTGMWTGSASIPWYWEAEGPWDVDNDGDGVPDSIWVDLGLPVRQMPDGRKYKPMLAILCTDLDGRLNVNVHGCSEQIRPQYTGNVLDPGSNLVYAKAVVTNPNPNLRRGQGAGPAEINLRPLLPTFAVPIPFDDQYRNLLLGAGGLNGRYGEMQWIVWNGTPRLYHLPAAGVTQTNALPAWPYDGTIFNDPLSINMHYSLANNYFSSVFTNSIPTEYGTPIDLKGTITVGIDLRGRPIYSAGQSVSTTVIASGYTYGWNAFAFSNAGTNDPYEMDATKRVAGGDLNKPASEDSPFTVGEFERVWRPFDTDTAGLPSRLVSLAPLLNPQPTETRYRRHMATPESWDLPCPAAAVPADLLEDFRDLLLRDFASLPFAAVPPPLTTAQLKAQERYRWAHSLFPMRSAHDIVSARLYVDLRYGGATIVQARDAVELSLPAMMPAELFAGLKMDVNRPFGNGRDDGDGVDNDSDGTIDELDELGADAVMNGIVDEPLERFLLAGGNLVEQMYLKNAAGGVDTVAFDHDNDGNVSPDEHRAPAWDPPDGAPAPPEYAPWAAMYTDYAYRQAYARHLYVMMMAIAGEHWFPPNGPYLNPPVAPPAVLDPAQPGFNQAAYQTFKDWQLPERARAVAQWAVNVVDFRDRDTIVTPFEYDVYPFIEQNPLIVGAWDVDGRINTQWLIDYVGGVASRAPGYFSIDDNASNNYRGLVWGCERPELLITETTGLHDRRTQNLDDGGGKVTTSTTPPPPDTDFDQAFVPQGSLYVELFNPWTNNEPRPGEFYMNRNGGSPPVGWRNGVMLNQQTPGRGDPVWRLAIVGPALVGGNFSMSPDAAEMARDPDDLNPANPPVAIERSIYFFPPDPLLFDDPNDGTPFFPSLDNSSGTPTQRPMAPILPHRYAVIGPGDPDDPSLSGSAPTDSTTYVGMLNDPAIFPPSGTPTTRRIELTRTANGVGQVAVFGNGEDDDLDRTAPSTPHTNFADFPPATQGAIQAPVAVIVDAPRRLSVSEPLGGYPGTTPANYEPLVSGYVQAPEVQPDDFTINDADGNAAVWTNYLSKNATHPRFRMVHLQRLADPTRDFDPLDNPYRTIDTAQIDLTTFNGVDSATFTNVTPKIPNNVAADTYMFATRERGETTGVNNLWSVELPAPTALPLRKRYIRETRAAPIPHHFDEDFTHTLGYVNEMYGNPRLGPAGYVGAPFTPDYDDSGGTVTDDLLEATTTQSAPFPWLNWNNRPFVSHLELAMVPDTSSSYLLRDYNPNTTTTNPYQAGVGSVGHLANFFDSDDTVGSPPAHFYRLLEFVHVPSRFVLTEDQLDAPTAADGLVHAHHPPFHGISRYRDPGRINLNTVFDSVVYDGLMNRTATADMPDAFVRGRRGYPGTGSTDNDEMFLMAPGSPTRFANPYRSFSGLERVPLTILGNGIGQLSGTGGSGQGVNATLLRANFTTTANPLWAYNSSAQSDDPTRNPYFRYHNMQRLGNLTTSRSNVYATWITVGYFEVEQRPGVNVDRNIYQEGFTLGRELGSDTGEVKRHRGFYLIDRSIPVAFQRGSDLNVEDTIVLKRFIE